MSRWMLIPRAMSRLSLIVLLATLGACGGQTAPAPAAGSAPAAAPPPAGSPAAQAAPAARAAAAPVAAPAPAATAAAPAANAAPVAPLSPPVDVKMGVLNISGDISIYLAIERGYFEEEGLRVEMVPFRSGTEQIPLLATNQLQFGAASLDAALLNAVARGVDLRIVGEKARQHGKYQGVGVIVRADLYANGTLDSVEKLKGRNFAVVSVGNTTDLYVERTLQKGGLTPADVALTTMPIADMAGAMANGAIDAAWMFEPFTTLTTRAGIGRQLVDVSQVAPEFYLQFLLVAEQFAEQNPEAVRRFVTAHMRGQRDYYRAFVTRESPDSEREALIDLWAKYTAVKDRALYEDMGYSAVEPNGYIDPAVLDIFQDWAFQKGLIPQKVDMRKLIDPQYTEYAVGRLGRLPDPFR